MFTKRAIRGPGGQLSIAAPAGISGARRRGDRIVSHGLLKGLHPLLTADLLHVLRSAGHGETEADHGTAAAACSMDEQGYELPRVVVGAAHTFPNCNPTTGPLCMSTTCVTLYASLSCPSCAWPFPLDSLESRDDEVVV